MLVRFLRRLRRFRFTYLSPKGFRPRLNAILRALFALSVFYANWCSFQIFRKFFRRVLPIFLFYSGTAHQRRMECQSRDCWVNETFCERIKCFIPIKVCIFFTFYLYSVHVARTSRAREEIRLSPHVPVGRRGPYSGLESGR